jgi:hypothetical protein
MYSPGLAERIRQRTHNSPQAGSTPAPWIIVAHATPLIGISCALLLDCTSRLELKVCWIRGKEISAVTGESKLNTNKIEYQNLQVETPDLETR